jgi:putative transposase
MPSKRKPNEGATSGSGVSIPPELMDRLVQGPMTPEEVQAICLDFKKALIERAMGAEPSPGLPSGRGAPRGPG